MKSIPLLLVLNLSLLAQTTPPKTEDVMVDRVGDTGFIQIKANDFEALDARQRQLAYWLVQASIAIDPVIYDQVSHYGLRQKRLLEEIVAHPTGVDSTVMPRITQFAKLFWANRGNHNLVTSQKVLPAFTFEELQQAALTAQKRGAMKTPYADCHPCRHLRRSPGSSK